MSFDKLLQQSLLWRGFYFITLLLLNILLSRQLQASGSGVLFYLSSFFSLIVLLVGISLDSGLTFFAAGEKIPSIPLAWFAALWCIAVFALLYTTFPTYYLSLENKSIPIAQFYGLGGAYYVTGILLMNFFMVLYYANGNFSIPNIVMGAGNLLFVIVYTCFPQLASSAEILMMAYFKLVLFQGIALLLVYAFSNQLFNHFDLPSPAQAKQLLRYSFTALAANLLFFFVYRIDYWFVKNNSACSAADLGNYLQASKLGQLSLVIPQILASAVFPQMASGRFSQFVSTAITVLIRLFIQLFLFIFIVLALIGNWVFIKVFGASFNTMYLPLLLLLPGILSLSILSLLSAYFAGKHKVWINVAGAAIALVVVVVGNCSFLHQYSILVAAIVSTIGYTANLLFALYHFKQMEQFRLRTLCQFSLADWKWLQNMLFNK